MKPIVSVLIATRGRVHRCVESIESICKTATTGNFEILLRIDRDDTETLNNIHLLTHKKVSHIVIGDRYQGYVSHSTFMDELVGLAKGEWLFFLDDDGVIIGQGWDEQLAEVPKHGKIVHPEFYWLGESHYGSGSCDPVAICVPYKCWEQYWGPGLRHPNDMWLQNMLTEKGWTNHLLTGIIAYHKRDDEETLAQHRKL